MTTTTTTTAPTLEARTTAAAGLLRAGDLLEADGCAPAHLLAPLLRHPDDLARWAAAAERLQGRLLLLAASAAHGLEALEPDGRTLRSLEPWYATGAADRLREHRTAETLAALREHLDATATDDRRLPTRPLLATLMARVADYRLATDRPADARLATAYGLRLLEQPGPLAWRATQAAALGALRDGRETPGAIAARGPLLEALEAAQADRRAQR